MSAVGGLNKLRVDWNAGADGLKLALFVGQEAAGLLSETPVATPTESGHLVLAGVETDQDYFLALGVREEGQIGWTRAGGILKVRTGQPVFVDPMADPAVADGTTPETAFSAPIRAILTAFSHGGGSVWFAAGEYTDTALPVFDGVSLFGGFGPGFELEEREPLETPTVLSGIAGFAILDVRSSILGAALDGLILDGGNGASVGIDGTDAILSIRNVHVRACAGRGIRLRAPEETEPVRVSIQHSSSSENGGDGLSVAGAFDIRLDSSIFASNVQEGADFDDLIAPTGKQASLRVRGCSFRANGTDGLDVDLKSPTFAFSGSGHFLVRVERSVFEFNGENGLLIDADYESAPTWSADVSILGCRSRANGGSGIHLDLDGVGAAFIHRALSNANAGDGVWISSESNPGHVLLTASAFLGNGGYGLRSTFGNQLVIASHCVVGGNDAGGIGSFSTRSEVLSTVFHNQPNPTTGARVLGSVDTTLPAGQVFLNAPEHFARVISFDGTTIVLDRAVNIGASVFVETDDDDVARVPGVITADRLTLDPAPLGLPRSLAIYPAGSPVIEDLRLAVGSPAEFSAHSLPWLNLDAGVFGAPRGGAPGTLELTAPELFRFASLAPATSPTSNETLTLSFAGGTLDSASVTSDSLRAITDSGTEIDLVIAFANNDLLLLPASGDWGTEPFRLELLTGLSELSGEPLVATLVIPIQPVSGSGD